MRHTYYKPVKLIIGITTIVFSCLGLGYLYAIEQPNIYLWALLLLGMMVGEGFILDAASFVKEVEDES